MSASRACRALARRTTRLAPRSHRCLRRRTRRRLAACVPTAVLIPVIIAAAAAAAAAVQINGVRVKSFVDSGAQSTIMSAVCAERCGLMRLVDRRFHGEARGVSSLPCSTLSSLFLFPVSRVVCYCCCCCCCSCCCCLLGGWVRAHQNPCVDKAFTTSPPPPSSQQPARARLGDSYSLLLSRRNGCTSDGVVPS